MTKTQQLISKHITWCLGRNCLATKENKLPVIFVNISPHVTWVRFSVKPNIEDYNSDQFSYVIIAYKEDLKTTLKEIKRVRTQYRRARYAN